MGVLGNRYIMHLLMIQLLGCLGCQCNIALAQFDLAERVTGSVSNPDIALACFGNLAVFVTSLLRGRLDLELGARDVLATMRVPGLDKLTELNKGFGLTTFAEGQPLGEASVVMLSYDTPITSMRQFMKYFSEAYKVHSILLQCFPLKSKSAELLPGLCNCKGHCREKCNCIVLWNVEEIVMILARRMPGRLKRLSESLCLLPSPQCLETGCHGCNQGQGQLYVEETEESERKILTEGGDTEKGHKAVKDIFEYISAGEMKEQHSCICIPLSPQGYDRWTQLLKRSLGATGRDLSVRDPSFIAPRLAEVLLNVVLTGWFGVDGFSSALVARTAIKEYVVQGGGFAANAFLAGAFLHKGNGCCVLSFRGNRSGIRTFSFIIGFANFICFITWVVQTAFQGRAGKWYHTHSVSPSILRIVMIMVAIGMAMGMDCLHLYLRRSSHSEEEHRPRVVVWCVIVLEAMFILFGSIIAIILGIQVVGRRLYSALHVLVWIKWATGSYLLGDNPPEYENDPRYNYDNGILVYSSAFWLNFILAAVRSNWKYSLSMPN